MRIHAMPRRHSPWSLVIGATALMALLALTACSTPRTPEGIQAVTGFDVDRYTGHWHEVARIDHSFERGLTQTSATYSRNPDDTVKVVNRGYDPVRKEWKEAEGTASFVDAPTRAALKVSFFGPFYGGYNVVALDENYQWAMVVGSSKDYLWILSRTPTLPWHVREHLIERAQSMGIDVGRILWAPPASEQHARRAVMT
ncbi:lipocalin family protein [Acidovorax sp. sif1233]|uniref:lipocalin family protein n=1 Tax=unclassified Acidovorax TaxID=2684926 RepID=UPI001C46BF85|nr:MULTISPECIES: lipocalin family protein [unclassified Acidovorax]MBV7427156.1 lipocalin family protein [Acidovorax sp. sif0732]MBV7448280.1 lipocalin family protein [Acidovorax sp. sif0715]MBV7454195.1 lipocalin family protein [Acidovorax sp. sif1233]